MNDATQTDSLVHNCTLPACGNGIVDPGEQCDDGNTTNGDGCDDNCVLTAITYIKASPHRSPGQPTCSRGAVYRFVRSGTTWSQAAYVKASNTDANDSFGFSVALPADGSMLVVGALTEASVATGVGGNQADSSASQAGAAYVYQ